MSDENLNDAPLLIWTWSEKQLCKIAGSANGYAIVAGFSISPEKLQELVAGGNYTLAAEPLTDPSKAKAGYIYFPKEDPFSAERTEEHAALAAKINELEKRGAELAETNAELERFAYIASHDLQEPLRMISGFLHLLKKKYEEQLDETGRQYIGFAWQGAERMKQLINDLLEYSRLGNANEAVAPIDLSLVAWDVMQLFREKLEEAGANVDIGVLPVVSGKKVQLMQLFQNLFSNAIKYRSKNPLLIVIGCEEKNQSWEFSFRDNGIGIDPKFREKVFEIFQRLHSKSEYSGTGIGLAVCKKIVERHGGKIWLESGAGEGCDFRFTLPKGR
jgi:light-regulated signal transduction histidine kinase (bacteriophytochrome)